MLLETKMIVEIIESEIGSGSLDGFDAWRAGHRPAPTKSEAHGRENGCAA